MAVAVYNPMLRRAWAKAAQIKRGLAGSRLNMVMFGDSVAGILANTIDARLKIELGNGGVAGRLAGENGFYDSGNGTNISQTTGDYTHSPNGVFWNLASGGSKYWDVGNNVGSGYQPLHVSHPTAFKLPSNCTRVGMFYTRRSGGGTFKVQTSTKSAEATFADVTGLTAIDTSGTLGVQYVEATITARDIARLRVEHVSGGDCYIIGALVSADIGVITHSWNVGGLPMTAMVNSPRFSELCALIPADVVMTSYLDSPGDTAASTGLSLAQLIAGIHDDIRAAFPATTVPADVSAWSGKTALGTQPPEYVMFAGNKVEASAIDQDAYNTAMRAYATATNSCHVDASLIWGSWRKAYDMGMMSPGDGSGDSTHPNAMYYTAVAHHFLKTTNLIGWYP